MSCWPRARASAKYVHLDVTRPDDSETVAMNRVGGPIETATLAVFLASEESSWSTGAELKFGDDALGLRGRLLAFLDVLL
jgi:NAD(P)-dependent dehydrogenase (short-subunit alcohol dehydrogenase family)